MDFFAFKLYDSYDWHIATWISLLCSGSSHPYSVSNASLKRTEEYKN